MPVINLNIDGETIEVHHDESNTVEIDRCDFQPMKVGSVTKTDEGYLQGVAPVARVGILKYMLPDGSIRNELVPPETLFNQDSMKSLCMKPVTDTHPQEVLLDKTTVKRRKVGMTGETVKKDNEYLVSSIVITDEDAIKNVEAGRQELSPGYRCTLAMQSGTFKGERYDAIQVKRVYNHLAICDRARGGRDIRLNIDHMDGMDIESNNSQKELSMLPKYKIDGIDYEAAQEIINFIGKIQAKNDELESKLNARKDSEDKLQATIDAQKEKIDSLEKRDIAKEISEGVTRRLGLVKTASVALDAEALKKIDSMSDLDIKKAVIIAKAPNANLDGKSEVYIDARFDSIVETLSFDPEAIARQRQEGGKRQDSTDADPVEKARKDSEERIKNAYLNLGQDAK